MGTGGASSGRLHDAGMNSAGWKTIVAIVLASLLTVMAGVVAVPFAIAPLLEAVAPYALLFYPAALGLLFVGPGLVWFALYVRIERLLTGEHRRLGDWF